MKKRLYIIILLMVALALPSNAVLKEANLDTTLYMLRTELTNYHIDLEKQNQAAKAQQLAVIQELISIVKQADQNSIMLYSQRNGYIFDMTYACHEATEQFKKFKSKAVPFRQMIKKNNVEVARFDSLINYLYGMSTMFLSEEAQVNRNVDLTLAVNIRRQLVEKQKQLQAYVQAYDRTDRKLQALNDYANRRYEDIQNSIFNNGGDNYLRILRNFSMNYKEAKTSVTEKYKPVPGMMSQWDVRIIFILFGIIIFWGLISIFLNLFTIRIVITQLMKHGMFENRKESFMAKRPCLIMAMTVVTFAVILGIVRMAVTQNFVIMASQLLVEYSWLVGVILVSILLRVDNDKIKNTFRIYSPLMLVGFIVIVFRIILIPNDLVNLIFPPVLLLCALWLWNVIGRKHNQVLRTDKTYAFISLAVFGVSTIFAWTGFTLLAVQLIIWWTMQLTCVLTITCCEGWLSVYAKRKKLADKAITDKWLYRFIYKVLLPISGVLSFIISIYWAADVFNMSDTTWEIFNKDYIKTSNFTASLFSISEVACLYFLFNYINITSVDFMRHHFEKADPASAASKIVMFKNVMQVIIWGIWLMIALNVFQVGKSWLLAIFAGLSTGLGFASKDILENIYYGISLMMGRVKVGDYIICDGTRGKVSSISYTSTMLEATDGSVIAFQNSQLFSKNYKNMTKNHGYELDILEVGIAYGSNVKEVKQILIDALMKLDCIYQDKGVKVLLKSFDDSCITLRIVVWVNVLTQAIDDATIMECIYDTLNDHNIEIPFPQREITIKQVNN
ncbi:mechanosensitive ion channel family protein [Prevotella copri]|uniref:Mechanosensitive ion channel family protein n=1 Tax=Segatella copri TaxID=165179 RepID=A0A3R6E8X8_9BACT|nr:mechanosensitive ion channel family protein [Segatella copri]MCP9551466.1 mechanosensitive ion channel family protein [Segatella copri]MCP9572067.1 mechanosensitive ion channel family protein [Segatella copri]MCP9575247.1 mechanosensitive ion channel family protein [Segatella copri]MCP9578193.1 mechanosensitive ion channel family protein [Segatella copri]MCP9581255.1 mechanosensitive ion channel family protein [Segatella copri]